MFLKHCIYIDFNFLMFINEKSIFLRTQGRHLKFLHTIRKEKIVSAFTKAKNEHERRAPNLICFKDLVSPKKLRNAWVQLKNKFGMFTERTTDVTLNSIENLWFEQTSQKLIEGHYKYPNKWKVWILKSGSKQKVRSLRISSFKVKIIEKAILNGIEPFFEGSWSWVQINKEDYETLKVNCTIANNDIKINKKGQFKKHWVYNTKFHSSSYGFRPGKSIYSSLLDIKSWKKNTVWVLDYGVRKVFNHVFRKRLQNIFLSYLNDPHLWKEIQKMLRLSIFKPSSCFDSIEVPQENVLAPFFFNLYMNELDKFVTKLKTNIFKGIDEFDLEANKEYNTLIDRFSIQRTTIVKDSSIINIKSIYKEKKKAYYKKWATNLKYSTFNFLQYVRYANNFLIGMIGSRNLALNVQKQINRFIVNNLHLKIKQNKIINCNEDSIKFLGFKIYFAKSYKKLKLYEISI